jgi:hypothetical protein
MCGLTQCILGMTSDANGVYCITPYNSVNSDNKQCLLMSLQPLYVKAQSAYIEILCVSVSVTRRNDI